jgi:hypothetical protein
VYKDHDRVLDDPLAVPLCERGECPDCGCPLNFRPDTLTRRGGWVLVEGRCEACDDDKTIRARDPDAA